MSLFTNQTPSALTSENNISVSVCSPSCCVLKALHCKRCNAKKQLDKWHIHSSNAPSFIYFKKSLVYRLSVFIKKSSSYPPFPGPLQCGCDLDSMPVLYALTLLIFFTSTCLESTLSCKDCQTALRVPSSLDNTQEVRLLDVYVCQRLCPFFWPTFEKPDWPRLQGNARFICG